MPRDKSASHIKIMAAAKEEFLEMGYEKASMRSIAERCGMTAAGIYRHCKDKEDLFYQLVSPAEIRLMTWAKEHMHRYDVPVKKYHKMVWQDSFIDMMREVIYPNMEDYHLLIAGSQGSKYESFLHDMTEMAQDKFLLYLSELRKNGIKAPDISPKQMHLLMTAYITALFEPVVHNYPRKEADEALTTLEKFFLPGWKKMMGV
ncbi:MAG: TetR/AcrR family transcriptional regulator [Lachnospiraceae bacterium]|nr:TetR/AcrR family transcriptional regulator [Lachnospiraceae bacterium]